MDFEEVKKEVKELTAQSACRVVMSATMERRKYDSFDFIDPHPYIVLDIPEVKYTFEVSDLEGYYTTIPEVTEDRVTVAIAYIKFLCRRSSIRCKIDSLIKENCGRVLREHAKGIEHWHKFLARPENIRLSVHESYFEAHEAFDKYLHSLKGKVKEYLELYYPDVLAQINKLNKELDSIHHGIAKLLENDWLRTEISTGQYYGPNSPIKYAYNFDEE